MTGLPWFRLYVEFAADPVIQSLAFEDQRHYVVLLCLKCSGTLDRRMSPGIRERIIQRGLGLDQAAANEAKRRLCEVGLINESWQPKAWEKRQFKSDSSTDRVRNHRKNKKSGNVTVTPYDRFGNAPDTEQNRTEKTLSRFAQFWEVYPKKKSKGQAERAFLKISPDEQLFLAILAGVGRAKNSEDWLKDGGKFIPHPATWLNARGWEDEVETADFEAGAR